MGSANVLASVQIRTRGGAPVKVAALALQLRFRALQAIALSLLLVPTYGLRLEQAPVSPNRARIRAIGLRLPADWGWLGGGFEPASAGQAVDKGARDALARDLDNSVLRLTPGDQAVWDLLRGETLAAVSTLVKAAEADPSNPSHWSDLSAAYLTRYFREVEKREPYDLILALWAADRALEVSPVYPHMEAQLNLALTLTELRIDRAAQEAWNVLLAHEPPPFWLEVVQRKSREVAARRLQSQITGRSRAELKRSLILGEVPSALLLREAQPFVRLELEDALPSMLLLFLRSSASAGERVRIEAFIRWSRDVASVSHDFFAPEVLEQAYPAIERAGLDERRRWAFALGALEEGTAQANRKDFVRAEPALRLAVEQLGALGSPLQWSAGVRWQEALLNLDGDSNQEKGKPQPRRAEELASLGRSLARFRYPGLTARTLWLEGLALAGRGDWTASLQRMDDSLRRFQDLKEAPSEGAVRSLRGEFLRFAGRSQQAWRERVMALRPAGEARDLQRIHNILLDAQEAARGEGLDSLALRLQGIALQDDLHARVAHRVVETLTLKAKGLLEAERLDEAKSISMQAEEWLGKIDRSLKLRKDFECEIETLKANILALQDRNADLETLTDAIGKKCPPGSPALRPDQLEVRAQAFHARGQLGPALQAEEGAVWEVFRQQGRRPTAFERKSFLDQNRVKLDRLLEWLVEATDADRALKWVLEAFSVESSGGSSGRYDNDRDPDPKLRLAPKDGEGVLVLYSTRSRVLGWLVTSRGSTPFQADLDRKTLSSLRSALAIEFETGEGRNSTALSRLSRELLGQVGDQLTELKRLIVVPSDELRGIPFAALVFPSSRSFLIEKLETVSIAVPAVGVSHSDGEFRLGADSVGLFVGNPWNTVAQEEEFLPDLPSAEEEAESAARLFPRSRLPLLGVKATKPAVVEELPSMELAHIAAHAARGETGTGLFLAAPSEERGSEGFLRGDEIAELDLQGLQLVVLSACRSAEPGRPAVNAEGLVEPFLAAGTHSVIASLWLVKDELSPRLWEFFYPKLQAGASPAEALGMAQRECLKNPNLANPAFWAGFAVYHGDLPMKGE